MSSLTGSGVGVVKGVGDDGVGVDGGDESPFGAQQVIILSDLFSQASFQ